MQKAKCVSSLVKHIPRSQCRFTIGMKPQDYRSNKNCDAEGLKLVIWPLNLWRMEFRPKFLRCQAAAEAGLGFGKLRYA